MKINVKPAAIPLTLPIPNICSEVSPLGMLNSPCTKGSCGQAQFWSHKITGSWKGLGWKGPQSSCPRAGITFPALSPELHSFLGQGQEHPSPCTALGMWQHNNPGMRVQSQEFRLKAVSTLVLGLKSGVWPGVRDGLPLYEGIY